MGDAWTIEDLECSGPISHVLVFTEKTAVLREDLVAEAAGFLGTLPGVIAADLSDNEPGVVEIAAAGVPTWDLTAAFRPWWRVACQEQRPWQQSMDRAVAAASNALEPHGYVRQEWRLTRVVDDEIAHLIDFDHYFGPDSGQHTVTAVGSILLARVDQDTVPTLAPSPSPPGSEIDVVWFGTGLVNERDLVFGMTHQVLPALNAWSSVDRILDVWQRSGSVRTDGRRTPAESRLHAGVLASRGQLLEARDLLQRDFETVQPCQRPTLLRLAARLGVAALTTAANPRISVSEERALRGWEANVGSLIDRLRTLVNQHNVPARKRRSWMRGGRSAQLDGSRDSVEDLWCWLRQSQDHLRAALDDAQPTLPLTFLGFNTRSEIEAGRMALPPWHRTTVELITAYLGTVVTRQVPGTNWGIAHDGELALVCRGGAGILSRTFGVTRSAFAAPEDHPGHKVTLADLSTDLVRWVNTSGEYESSIVTLRGPGTLCQ